MNESLILIPATSFWQRLSGLYGRDDLPENTGLWIAPCRAIHTVGMVYCIDVLYLDARHNVIRRIDAMPPWRLSACLRACSVVELPAGFCSSHPGYGGLVQRALQLLHV